MNAFRRREGMESRRRSDKNPPVTIKGDDPPKLVVNMSTGSPDYSMLQPKLGRIYVIELCSGELRHWRYLGPSGDSKVWWRDMEAGFEFSENSVMYAWRIIGNGDEKFQP